MSNVPPPAVEVPTRANTAAVVVLFNPEGALIERLRRVQAQVSLLFVIANDNGTSARLTGLDLQLISYIQNSENLGLAGALNAGLSAAQAQGFAWCLLLDQDTMVDTDLVLGLAETLTACPDGSKAGLLVPNYRSPNGGRIAYPTNVEWQYVATAVTSGTLVPLKVIKRLGDMHEAFFIEGIDIEFCLRVRAAGLYVVASGRPLMTHGAGATEERRLFGRTVLIGNHSPSRCFLQYRNLTWILLKYGTTDLKWAGGALVSMAKRAVLLCIFERQRGAKLWAMLRGVATGICQALLHNVDTSVSSR